MTRFRFVELSHAEIGVILNCSAEAFEMRLHRAGIELRDKPGWPLESSALPLRSSVLAVVLAMLAVAFSVRSPGAVALRLEAVVDGPLADSQTGG